jgi:hypothetical protein
MQIEESILLLQNVHNLTVIYFYLDIQSILT